MSKINELKNPIKTKQNVECVTISTTVSDTAPLVGTSVDVVCTGNGMTADDVIWYYFPNVAQPAFQLIYKDQALQISRFTVVNVQVGGSVISTLTIPSVTLIDGTYVFECQCNLYKACKSIYHQ